MRIKCPVALCLWEGKTHQFAKHIEDYKIKWKDVMDSGFSRSESHERWANYFFKEIWSNPNLDDKTKWTNIAVAYMNQIKNQNRETRNMKMQHTMMQRRKKLSPDGSDNIEMHDGRVFMNGQEYTPEEFSKIMPGIKMPQNEGIHHPHIVQDITGELRIDGMTLDEYRKMHAEQRRPK